MDRCLRKSAGKAPAPPVSASSEATEPGVSGATGASTRKNPATLAQGGNLVCTCFDPGGQNGNFGSSNFRSATRSVSRNGTLFPHGLEIALGHFKDLSETSSSKLWGNQCTFQIITLHTFSRIPPMCGFRPKLLGLSPRGFGQISMSRAAKCMVPR